MLTGPHTALRAIEPGDLDQLRDWRNKPELRRYFREYREISEDMQRKWYEQSVLNDPSTRMFAIIERSTDRLLGACGLCYIDWINRNADFSIYIGADGLYIDNCFAPEAAHLLLSYGFNELTLHRVWAEIYSIDEPKQAFFDTIGFRKEGTHRETHFTEGVWVDSLFYGLLAKDYTSGA